MEQILIVGKLKDKINIKGQKIQIEDSVNDLSTDFIIQLISDSKTNIGYESEKKIETEEVSFSDEIIRYARRRLCYKEKKFILTLSRKTYQHATLIECNIQYEEDCAEDNLFGAEYEFKIKIKEWLKEYCRYIYWIHDDNNSRICTKAYEEVHEIENMLRQILSLFMMRKCGDIYLSNDLEKEYKEYSKFYNTQGYTDFKDINSMLYNISFSRLPELLNLNVSQAIIDEESTIKQLVDDIVDELENVGDITYCYKNINVIQKKLKTEINKINKGEHIFDNSLLNILDKDFKDEWKSLSGMRNMIMHNKPICKSLFYDIKNLCDKEAIRFNKCIENIECCFYTEEEYIFDCLCDEQSEKEQYESEFIEQERENVGIEFLLDEDYVMTRLSENEPLVTELIDILRNIKDSCESMENVCSDISYIKEYLYSKNIKDVIKQISELSEKMNIPIELEEPDEVIDDFIFAVSNNYDIDQLYNDLADGTKINDYFTINEIVHFNDFDGNNYRVLISGELNPCDNGSDNIECILYKNSETINRVFIDIDYGTYTEPSEGGIDCNSLKSLNEILNDISMDLQKKVDETSKKVKVVMSFYNLD